MTLGVNMLMHGLTRIISGLPQFVENMAAPFIVSPLPMFLVKPALYAIPIAELIIGAMMILGFFTRYALIAGAFLITLLTFGSSAKQDWGAAGVQVSYAIAFALLLFGLQYNRLKIKD